MEDSSVCIGEHLRHTVHTILTLIFLDVFKYQHKSKIRLELTPTSSTSRSELHYSREDLIAKPAADSSTLSSETQGKLIDKYFEEWNPLFPILDKADVETYSEDTNTALKTRQDKGRLALKYLVLSVGSLSGAVSSKIC